jgi:hypothetical protein
VGPPSNWPHKRSIKLNKATTYLMHSPASRSSFPHQDCADPTPLKAKKPILPSPVLHVLSLVPATENRITDLQAQENLCLLLRLRTGRANFENPSRRLPLRSSMKQCGSSEIWRPTAAPPLQSNLLSERAQPKRGKPLISPRGKKPNH